MVSIANFRRPVAHAAVAFLVVGIALISGCASIPKDAFQLPPTSLEDRKLQSRLYSTLDHDSMLSASAGVLQDLGYALDVSNGDLGVLTASKDLDATNAGQIAGAVLLAALTGTASAVDKNQKVRVCVVVNESLESKGSSTVRITINRVIWNTQGQITRAEAIKEPELYQAFFDKLSKSTFLEAHQI